eukprot:362452-Chlamydomonas_euryale.AAC.4
MIFDWAGLDVLRSCGKTRLERVRVQRVDGKRSNATDKASSQAAAACSRRKREAVTDRYTKAD